MSENNLNRILPVLPLKGLVVFPEMLVKLSVERTKSVLAVKDAFKHNRKIFLATQVNPVDEPKAENLYQIGMIAQIKELDCSEDKSISLSVKGIKRAELISIVQDDPYMVVEIEVSDEQEYNTTSRTQAISRIVLDRFNEYLHLTKIHVSKQVIIEIIKEKNCGRLADLITPHLILEYEQKQFISQELHPVKRLNLLADVLTEEIKILKIENEIASKTRMNLDEMQREYFLREQIKVISSELGENIDPIDELDNFRNKIHSLNLEESVQEKLLSECDKLSKLPNGSHEGSVIRTYLETCLALPWNTRTRDKVNIAKAEKILNSDHYGLEKVKERFIEILAVRKLNEGNFNSQIVCLVGPPGVGKTSIAKSIAKATGKKYVRVSLGGVQDVADIMGHRKTYVGSMMGRIMAAVKQAGVKNPLILLDEIDKLGQSFKGDPSSALLEVLDAEQNKAFHDHYIDLPFDLSEVLFVTTANDPSYIPSPLYDRMDVINLSSYTANEKQKIATKYLIPKQIKAHGIKLNQLKFTPTAVSEIINGYTREAGVRSLERQIATICRKVAKIIVTDEDFKSYKVTVNNLKDLLGVKKISDDITSKNNEIGLVNGLAWTSVGGELLPIEVAAMDGSGKIQLTGSLGDVMKESASTAITCIRTRSKSLGIKSDFYNEKDIHIHAPEAAIPKDGPSAGVAMSVAICSALTGIPIRHDVAMTGEVTLQGRVLKIGGLKEKSMAAYRNNIKTVIIPDENFADVDEFDQEVKDKLEFIPIKNVSQAFEIALCKMPSEVIISDNI
ncbi:MAG: endopeptidase La [Clostridia bacterium]